MVTVDEAIKRLKEGNERFVSGVRSMEMILNQQQRSHLVKGQEPFAIILGCSDSRVPAELVFDQGLGDLFVIRIAGNIVAPSQIGSVEFAIAKFQTPLVVVLGHSNCGAVCATIDALKGESEAPSSNELSIVNRIRPVVEPLLETELRHNTEKLIDAAIRSNIRYSVNQLRHGSERIETYTQQGRVRIIGAEYCLDKGKVQFFD
jgi:carbonic anhydrase